MGTERRGSRDSTLRQTLGRNPPPTVSVRGECFLTFVEAVCTAPTQLCHEPYAPCLSVILFPWLIASMPLWPLLSLARLPWDSSVSLLLALSLFLNLSLPILVSISASTAWHSMSDLFSLSLSLSGLLSTRVSLRKHAVFSPAVSEPHFSQSPCLGLLATTELPLGSLKPQRAQISLRNHDWEMKAMSVQSFKA